MYKIQDFAISNRQEDSGISIFINLLKNKWDEIHTTPGVFRYPINDLQYKIVNKKYILLLNTERGSNRRTPEDFSDIRQPFDNSKFNFTKVSQKEILFSIDHDGEEHTLLVNVSPISKYHTLLCPSAYKKLPQVVTEESLVLVLEIMFCAHDSDLKIAFNSMCALASVNHLHFHLLFEKHTFPVQLAKWKHIKNDLHVIEDYPAPAFCFEVKKTSLHVQAKEIFKLLQYFLDKSIAHNIIMTMRSDNVAIYIWPRKTTNGVKQMSHFNVAALEFSGLCTVYSTESFKTIEKEQLEKELSMWKIDNFDSLCKEVELLHAN